MFKTLLFTNEYPPNIYGGAGIHVQYLARELAKLCKVEVRCFGNQKSSRRNLSVKGFALNALSLSAPKSLQPIFGTFQRCLDFNATDNHADLVHCHTWYTHLGGILAKQNFGIPLVITVHSLEPLRPWKREQLGGGYDVSCWIEKTALEMADAIIAVSAETKKDILRLFKVSPEKVHILHNGIDPKEYRPIRNPKQLERLGVNPNQPYVLFVGRITRQKGIIHLVNAIRYLRPEYQVVLCAGAPDTPEIAREMKAAVHRIRRTRKNVVWIREMVNDPAKIALYSHATVFCCPSIYEPFGIINLEAMACETPVVASAVGGIKEVVVEGKTGFLVPLKQQTKSPFEPLHPDKFARDLARKINFLMANPTLQKKMGKAGRERALKFFSWSAIAEKTFRLYRSLID